MNSHSPPSRGVLLFAHGARDPAWATPFHAVAQELRAHQTADIPVELAFLEFMEPSLVNAAESLLRRGIQHLDVIPLFLGAGGHVRKDLPGLIDALKSDHPDLQVVLHPAVGESPLVVTAMAQAALGFAALP